MKLLSALPLLAISFSVPAQTPEADAPKNGLFTNWGWSIKAGPNVSNMYGDVGNNAYMPFFHVGAVARRQHSEKLAIGVEPHVSIEGQNLNGGYDRIVYCNIPVVLKRQVANSVSLDGGLHLGVKIWEQTKFGTTGEKLSRNRFKRLAPGLTLGSTVDFTDNWFAQFQVHTKFPDVVRKEGGDSEGSIILLFQLSIARVICWPDSRR